MTQKDKMLNIFYIQIKKYIKLFDGLKDRQAGS